MATPAPLDANEFNGFDVAGGLVPAEKILRGGPARDGIPAIDHPVFFSAAKAKEFYPADSRALVVRHANEVKVYPIRVLDWHEVVNDTIGGVPIAVTWCPLCGAGVVFRAQVGKDRLRFGVSGLLYQSDVLLYDRATESLWSQLQRQAISGKHKGTRLQVLPSKVVCLETLLDSDKVQVLSTQTGCVRAYSREAYANYKNNRQLMFPVEYGDDKAPAKAWSAILIGPDASLIVPLPSLDPTGKTLQVRVGSKRVDLEYDSDTEVLNCTSPVKGITCLTGYYFALRAFHPEARVYEAERNGTAKK